MGDAVVAVAFSVGEHSTKLRAVGDRAVSVAGDKMRRRFKGGHVGDKLRVPTQIS